MSAGMVTLLGLGLFLTPFIMILMAIGPDDGDVNAFLAKQPLKFILVGRLMIFAGLDFCAFGALLSIMKGN